jgi:pyruvate-formate lyase-activating enzyme
MDESLNSYLSEIKAEVKAIMQFVSQSSQIKEPDRQSFTKELGEVLKLSSAAKIIATVPLIPGFLEYKKEINLVTDWNKWLDKLASLFKRRD